MGSIEAGLQDQPTDWKLLDNNTRVWTVNEGKIPCLWKRGSGNY